MKGKIIVDIPEECDECILLVEDGTNGKWCCKLNRVEVDRKEKPYWCPIKPIKEEKAMNCKDCPLGRNTGLEDEQ